MVLSKLSKFKSTAESDPLEHLWTATSFQNTTTAPGGAEMPPPSRSRGFSQFSNMSSDGSTAHTSQPQAPASRILFEGNLSKEGMAVKNWKMRYVRLHEDALAYYAVGSDETAQKPKKLKLKKRIPLKRGQLVAKAPERSLTKDFCFKLITHQRCYYFVAPNEAVRMEWINAIKDALLNLRDEDQLMIGDSVGGNGWTMLNHAPNSVGESLPAGAGLSKRPQSPDDNATVTPSTPENISHRALTSVINRFPPQIVEAFKKEREALKDAESFSDAVPNGKRDQASLKGSAKTPRMLPIEAFHDALLHQAHLLTLKIPGSFYFLQQYLLFYSKIMSKETVLYFRRDDLNFIEKMSEDSFYLRVMNNQPNVKHLFSVSEVPVNASTTKPAKQEDDSADGVQAHDSASSLGKSGTTSSSQRSETSSVDSSVSLSRFALLMRHFKSYYSLPIIERQLQSGIISTSSGRHSKKDAKRKSHRFKHFTSSYTSDSADTETYNDDGLDSHSANDTIISSDEEEDTLSDDTSSVDSHADTAADIFGVGTKQPAVTPLSMTNHKLSFFHLNLQNELYINEKFREAFNPLYKAFNRDIFVPNIPEDEIIQFRFYCTFEDTTGEVSTCVEQHKDRHTAQQPSSLQNAITAAHAPTTPSSPVNNHHANAPQQFLSPDSALNNSSFQSLNVSVNDSLFTNRNLQCGQVYITNHYLWFHGRASPFSPIVKWAIPFTSIEAFHYTQNTIRVRVFPHTMVQLSGGDNGAHQEREEYFLHIEDDTTLLHHDAAHNVDNADDFFLSTSVVSASHHHRHQESSIFVDMQDLNMHHFDLSTIAEVRIYRILVHLHNAFYKTNPPIDHLFPFIVPLPYEPLSSRIKLSPHIDGISSYAEYTTSKTTADQLKSNPLLHYQKGVKPTARGLDEGSKLVSVISDYFSVENAEKRSQASESAAPPRPIHKFKVPPHCSIIDHFTLNCFRAWGKQKVHLVIYQNILTGEMMMQLTPVGKSKSIKRASFRSMSCILRDPKSRDRFYISFGAKRWKFSETNHDVLQKVVTVLDKIHKQAMESVPV